MLPSASAELRVPKRRVVVELASPEQELRRAELFVAEQVAGAERWDAVVQLLEHQQRYLPARDLADDRWAFVNKDRLLWVAVPLDEEIDLSEGLGDEPCGNLSLFDLRCEVRVELAGGAILDGKVLYSAPAGQGRLSDFLNQVGRFWRLYTERSLVLVNQAFVVRVIEAKRASATAIAP